ncbi:MAG: energy-coupling factor ABC transporter ATP-binding protein [Rhodocyclaceae bacterium]|nr:energy-coupling factor ABC transporter ATP-binding protein [Rhodocyclaceae bacterium]
MTDWLFELDRVSLAYPDGQLALGGIDLAIGRGERIVVLGANGCGKSSLLKLLNGLVLPSNGELRFCGERVDARRLRDRDWCRAFRRRVVLMFQHPEAMLFNPTVAEEIAYGLGPLEAPERERRVRDWASRLGLAGRLEKPPFQLSGGEKQRLCLACLLAMEPEVLLLDEPTANLDPRTVGWFVDWLSGQPVTTVIATHHLSLAAELGSRCVIVSENHRIVFDGPTEAALQDVDLLLAHNLAHRHTHRHGADAHRHAHVHPDWF